MPCEVPGPLRMPVSPGPYPVRQVGLVIDLTKSWQYYSVEEWLGVAHHKVLFGVCDQPVYTHLRCF